MALHWFEFGTKAENLQQLSRLLTKSRICDSYILEVREYERRGLEAAADVCRYFQGVPVIVRSSAKGEDSLHTSMAGAFESVGHVDSSDVESVSNAINRVIASYDRSVERPVEGHQVLIQPMLQHVSCSGVVFTRDLNRLSPYYVINYDRTSGKTDTITAGYGSNQETLYVYKQAALDSLSPWLKDLLVAVKEIEAVTQQDRLDIEFAVGTSGNIYILQVRPMVATKILWHNRLDQRIEREQEYCRQFLRHRLQSQVHLYGDTTILGQMPDWNPAEIIGAHPRPLAASLYDKMIMHSAWRTGRAMLGYHDPAPHPLMVTIAGRPYVDVRCSFNSLLPAGLPASLSNKLVNEYVRKLRSNPHLHDKVEFEIVISCLTLDFERQAERLRSLGFVESEVNTFKRALLSLTDDIVHDAHGVLQRLQQDVIHMSRRRQQLERQVKTVEQIPYAVQMVLDECITYGTIPFSAMARCAFIATSFLKSFQDKGIWSSEQFDRYMLSIETVATRMIKDLRRYHSGQLTQADFLSEYGHLRPGTYDILSYSYAEKPDLYLGKEASPERVDVEIAPYEFTQAQRKAIEQQIQDIGFTFSFKQLIAFIQNSIQQRESIKFEFTKSLSLVLTWLARYGNYHGFSRDDLSYLHIEDLLQWSHSSHSSSRMNELRMLVDHRRSHYELTRHLIMPDLITHESDIELIQMQERKPNFITQKTVKAPLVKLDLTRAEQQDLEGKIVVIENADPGFDWIFTRRISGLITKYGGVASHMAIRCAEFGLPAAIGCGEKIFSRMQSESRVMLDCRQEKIEIYGDDV